MSLDGCLLMRDSSHTILFSVKGESVVLRLRFKLLQFRMCFVLIKFLIKDVIVLSKVYPFHSCVHYETLFLMGVQLISDDFSEVMAFFARKSALSLYLLLLCALIFFQEMLSFWVFMI